MPAVGHPLAHISCESPDTPRIGREVSSGRRPPVAIAVVFEGVVPLAAGRRAVSTAGEVARVARRRALAPRIDRGAAVSQHVLELGLAGQAVAMPALFGQPLGVGLGIPGAHMQDRQVLAGRGASVVAAPVDAAHAREVAAALVVCHRIAAARSEEHTSELQSLMRIPFAVLCWKKNIYVY